MELSRADFSLFIVFIKMRRATVEMSCGYCGQSQAVCGWSCYGSSWRREKWENWSRMVQGAPNLTS